MGELIQASRQDKVSDRFLTKDARVLCLLCQLTGPDSAVEAKIELLNELKVSQSDFDF